MAKSFGNMDNLVSLSSDPVARAARQRFLPHFTENDFATLHFSSDPAHPIGVRRDALEGLVSRMRNMTQASLKNVPASKNQSRVRRGTISSGFRNIEVDEVDHLDSSSDELAGPGPGPGAQIQVREKGQTPDSWPSHIRVFKYHAKASSSRRCPSPRASQAQPSVFLINSVLWITGRQPGWKDFAELPTSLKARLEEKFAADYTNTTTHCKTYYRSIKDKPRNFDKCFNHVIYRRSDKKLPPKWNGELETRDVACDQCAKQRRLCIRLVKVNGDARLGIYPLSDTRRGKSTVTDMSYWIRPVGAR